MIKEKEKDCTFCNAFASPRDFHYLIISNLYKAKNTIKGRCGNNQIGNLMNEKCRVSTLRDMKGFFLS